MITSTRRANILLAVIEGYLKNGIPVSSKWVCETLDFGLSSATIRSELYQLEEIGLLTHPHTSAGRIPTDMGYRFYVESMTEIGVLSPSEKSFLQRFFKLAGRELDKLMEESSSMIAEMTKCLSLIVVPMLKTSYFKHLELVKLSEDLALMVLITDAGRVEKRVFNIAGVSAERLDAIASKLNVIFSGLQIDQIKKMTGGLLKETSPEDFVLHKSVVDAVLDSVELDSGKVFFQGMDNLTSFPELEGIGSERLADLVKRVFTDWTMIDYLVKIGAENEIEELKSCALVARKYGISGRPLGMVGVIGPRRMDYPRVISLIDFAARSLSDKLSSIYS